MSITFDTKRSAPILGISEQHLRRLRSKGEGPTPTRIGGKVVYTANDLADFINKHREVGKGRVTPEQIMACGGQFGGEL